MSVEAITALLIAAAGLVGALTALFARLREIHILVNSRMAELVETAKLAGQKDGELAGRDYERARLLAGESAEERSEPPTRR